jgi:hypothetical protein
MSVAGQRADSLRPTDPSRLGGYTVVGRLGAGGMGVVYLARSPVGELVAIKVVHPTLALSDEFRARFRSEVLRARQVPPFCTAEVLDADPEHDPPYLVVEYVDGPSLGKVVGERGPLSLANLHAVAMGVATALTAIHEAGVVHRDLKPSNVLLAPGTPKVIDFGIARAFQSTTQLSRTDQLVGTVAYMAPERFGTAPSSEVGPAADVFSWGAVVAYAGTGRTPFHADGPTAEAARILTQPPQLDGLTGPLRELVEKALAKDPVDRPLARELREMLLTAAQPPNAQTITWFTPGVAPVGTPRRGRTVVLPRQPEPDEVADSRHGRRRTGRRVAWAATVAATLVAALAVATAVGPLGPPLRRLLGHGLRDRTAAAATLATGLPLNQPITLQVTTAGYTDRYALRQGQLAGTDVVDDASPAQQRTAATFWVRPGLADRRCLSLEASGAAGTFLRQQDFRVGAAQNDGSPAFATDATFCAVPGLSGQGGVSLQWYGNRGFYLRHRNSELWLTAPGDGTFTDDATWMVSPPWAPQRHPVDPPSPDG